MAADRSTASRSPGQSLGQSLGNTASELARRWAMQRVSAIQSYGRILADYGSGRSSGRDAAQAYAKLAVEEAARYPTEALGIATDYASAMARAAGLSFDADRTARPRTQVLDIELAGALGRVAARTVVLENPHDAPTTIGFTAANFQDGDGELDVRPTISPASIAIPACGEQAVKVSVKIDRKVFKPGGAYWSLVGVEGFDDMIIRVHLTVTGAA